MLWYFLSLALAQKLKCFLQASLMFLVQTSGLYYKSLTIVIYDCNDSTIVINDHNDCGQ